MFKYEFAILVSKNPFEKGETRTKVLSVSPPYEMLSEISNGTKSITAAKEVILLLMKVLSGEQEKFVWGSEFLKIESYNSKSVVTHIYVNGNDELAESEKELPTDWLLQLMEDWLKFLEKEEDGTEKILHTTWISPQS